MELSLLEIEQQASLLLPDERAKLAEFLLESLQEAVSSEIKQAWDDEIENRVKAFEDGGLTTFSAESVFAEAKRVP
jgi:putative addiction module component (TIGR02574 family)